MQGSEVNFTFYSHTHNVSKDIFFHLQVKYKILPQEENSFRNNVVCVCNIIRQCKNSYYVLVMCHRVRHCEEMLRYGVNINTDIL